MSLGRALEGIATPLDGLRQTAFGWALRSPLLPKILTRRDRRIAAIGTLHAIVALSLALLLPTLLFALGPVLFGVAHVAADIRYLVLRRELATWWRNVIWLGCAALIALHAAHEAKLLGFSLSIGEFSLTLVWAGLALVAGARASGSWTRALIAAPVIALAGWAVLANPELGLMVVVHGHNLIAVAVWAILFQRRLRGMLLPLAVIVGGSAALVSGTLHGVIVDHAKLDAFGLGLFELSSWLSPGLPLPQSVGLTVAYVFLQSVHYAIWLILIPQSDSGTEGTLTFRMSARSLLRDFGGAPLIAIALSALIVIGGAFFDVHEARRLYLSLAMFHVYLEFVLLSYFWARSSPARPLPARGLL